jgi:DNA processing protein
MDKVNKSARIMSSSPLYPKLLKSVDDSPKCLFYLGDPKKDIFKHCLAVVGSRKMTLYGKRITEQLVYKLASRGITIVSGFMYGIDMAAHKAALAAGGRTIAVIAYGIEKKPPNYLSKTYQEIINGGGLVISELPGKEPPKKWSFPKRNRIIAGLCQAVLVVEAAKKSGSLITAGYAQKYGREVFAVPGPLDSVNSEGTLQLIKDGSFLVTGVEELLEFFKDAKKTALDAKKSSFLQSGLQAGDQADSLQNEIMAFIREKPARLDIIVEALDLPVSQINQVLTRLLLSGHLEEEGGLFYAGSN